MGPIWVFLALLVAWIGILVCMPFLPIIQGFTNSTGVYVDLGIPLDNIMHLWPVWTILLIVVCSVIIFYKMRSV